MKQKIIASLKNKYANLGFGDKAIEQVAEFLSTTVTDEANIETAVGGVENLLKSFQAEADRRAATFKAELDKLKKPEGGNSEPTPKPEEPKPTGNPEIDKLMQAIQGLTQTVTGLVEKDKKTTLQTRWAAAAKEKGVTNPKLVEKWMPQSEEDFESALTDLTAFNTEYLKQAANEKSPGRPAGGGSGAGSTKTEDMLKAWADKGKTPQPPAEQKS